MHYQVEKEMRESGMDWTLLRPHHFMQNLLLQAEYIIKDGVVYSASGDGKIPYWPIPANRRRIRSRSCRRIPR